MFSLKEFPYPPQAGVAWSITDMNSLIRRPAVVAWSIIDMNSLIRRPAVVAYAIIDMKSLSAVCRLADVSYLSPDCGIKPVGRYKFDLRIG